MDRHVVVLPTCRGPETNAIWRCLRRWSARISVYRRCRSCMWTIITYIVKWYRLFYDDRENKLVGIGPRYGGAAGKCPKHWNSAWCCYLYVRPSRNRSEEHTSELQSPYDLVCRLLLEKKKKNQQIYTQQNNIIHQHITHLLLTNRLRTSYLPTLQLS